MTDHELARDCEADGYHTVCENLALGMSQREATAYLVGDDGRFREPPTYDDGFAVALREYIEALHRGEED